MNSTMNHPLGEKRKLCTGCAACAAACPADAITMRPDNEGFLQPQKNGDACTECGLCSQLCPVNSGMRAHSEGEQEEGRYQLPAVWAAWHLDEAIRRESSSGGVFSALAANFLASGGVVAGAAFDDQVVVRHTLIDRQADLYRLRGSKYVQSEVVPAVYHRIQGLLDENRSVFFSGTPCQVAALRSFLTKTYDTLFCCDIVCHGVPSPRLFARYVHENSAGRGDLAGISFRDKTTGWKNFSVRRYLRDGSSRLAAVPFGSPTSGAAFADPYMAAFLRDYALRASCYCCPFKGTHRYGDLTLADFWGVAEKYPEYDRDDKGTSLVLVNSQKGQTWLDACSSDLFLGPADLETAIAANPMIIYSCQRPPQRDTFYHDLDELSFSALLRKYRLCQPPFFNRVLRVLKRRLESSVRTLIGRSPKG